MPRQKKYRKGYRIVSVDALIMLLRIGNWVMLRDKPLHPKVVYNMTLETVYKFVRSGMIFTAEETTGGQDG